MSVRHYTRAGKLQSASSLPNFLISCAVTFSRFGNLCLLRRAENRSAPDSNSQDCLISVC